MLQCVLVCCSVLQCVAVCCITNLKFHILVIIWLWCIKRCPSVTRLIRMWTMTYSSMRHDSCINTAHPRHDLFVCVQWFIHMCDMTHTSDSARLWHTSSSCVSWLIHMCDMTHSYVWHDSFICLKCLIHMFEMPHSHVCHDSFICSAWRIHVCRDALNTGHLWHYLLVTWLDMTHSHGYHDPFIRSIWRIHMCVVTHYKRATCNIIYQWRDLTWLIHICAMTHSYLQSEEFICVSWRIQHELPVTLFVTDVIMFKPEEPYILLSK